MNEAETRAEHIDPALKAAGWGGVGLPSMKTTEQTSRSTFANTRILSGGQFTTPQGNVVMTFYVDLAGEPEHNRSLIGRHSHAPESHPLAMNLTVANGSTPDPRCPSHNSTYATPIRSLRCGRGERCRVAGTAARCPPAADCRPVLHRSRRCRGRPRKVQIIIRPLVRPLGSRS